MNEEEAEAAGIHQRKIQKLSMYAGYHSSCLQRQGHFFSIGTTLRYTSSREPIFSDDGMSAPSRQLRF